MGTSSDSPWLRAFRRYTFERSFNGSTMPFTIPESFTKLRSNLEISFPQATTVSTRQQGVRATISNGFKIVEDFLTGSYIRSTMISPLKEADVDIFVALDPSYYHQYNGQNGGQRGLLDYMRRTLLKTYTSTPDISRNGHAVTIRFSDFVVDVVVGFKRQNGGCIIANAVNNQWLETDPKKHVEIIAAANKVHNGNLVPIIKMLKSWNKSHSYLLRSFHIEVLALEVFDSVTISDFPSGIRFFFDRAQAKVAGHNVDPAGFGDDIGKYINTQEKLQEILNRLRTGFKQAAEAEQHAARGDYTNAIAQWRKIMPIHFSAHG